MPAMTKLGFLSLLSTAVLAVPTPLDVYPSGTAQPQALSTGHVHYHAGNATDNAYPSGTGRHRHRKHRITTTSTLTSTAVFTEYVTVSPSPAAESAPAVAAAAQEVAAAEANPASSPCSTPVVYETAVNVVTVTVEENAEKTPEAPAQYAAPSAASAAAPAAEQAAYDSGSTGTTENKADAPSASQPEVSLTFKPKGKEIASDVVAAAGVDLSGAAAAVETVAATSVSNHKRGVAYNDLQYTGCFANKKVSWAYNWGQVSGSLDSSFEYVPMLWGTRSDFLVNWVGNAKNAISGGSKNILAFNEPDLAAQSNMDPPTAASAYRTYIHNNFAGSGVRLGSPGVTNGGGEMGLTWLNNFLSACSGCQVDFVVIHWYDRATNFEYFKNHVTEAHTSTGKPVWLTEFAATGSDAEINSFLQQALPWLDSQDFVERYSYFMARDGLLNAGTELSPHGNTYATY